MATRTGTGIPIVNLGVGEFLQYTLTFEAAAPNMAWTDDQEALVLSSNDFPAVTPLKWKLQSAAPQNGSVVITVPEKGGYTRTVPTGSLITYGLALTFLTSPGYTLKVDRCNGAGTIQNVSDFQYKMGQPSDEILEDLNIQL
jgi:hypothetical protein